MKKIKRHGFTLAEILITLSIIGVVAALTIPTLIQRTGNEELVSRLHKAYSTLSQATEAIMTEQGAATVWATSVENIYQAYKEHLRNAKDCGSTSGCFTRTLSDGSIGVMRLDGKGRAGWAVDGIDTKAIILSDGTSVSFQLHSTADGCKKALWAELGLKDTCGGMWVDINGSKKPNQFGRDLFFFGIKKDGLYPAGVDDPSADYYDTCNKSGSNIGKQGSGCAAKVIAEGDMNY